MLESQAIAAKTSIPLLAMERTETLKVFDGSGDVATWLKKVKLVAKLKKVADLATFLPLYLEGSAFEVYDQMAERDKEAATEIEKTLLQAFALSTFEAYEEFRRRSWIPGEAVDVYLADLRRLARLANVEGDELLKCAFVVGFPPDVSAQLRSTEQTKGLDELARLARVLVANRSAGMAAAAADNRMSVVAIQKRDPANVTCFKCNMKGHYAKDCNKVKCFKCGAEGHIAKSWSAASENESGKQFAPVASRSQ